MHSIRPQCILCSFQSSSCTFDVQDLLDDEAVLDAIDEENEFQALVVSFVPVGLLCWKFSLVLWFQFCWLCFSTFS